MIGIPLDLGGWGGRDAAILMFLYFLLCELYVSPFVIFEEKNT